jgi:glyoxylase-like metal-dependent hydrolase (beta-lactamase superfamily II)
MKLRDKIHLVGSSELGLSDAWDCHVYALDCGDGIALIDAGGGRDYSIRRIEQNLRDDGFDPAMVKHVVLTHWHKDHAGGAHIWRQKYGATVWLNDIETPLLEGKVEQWRDIVPECPIDRVLRDDDTVRLGNLTLHVIQVPSHSDGICAFLLDLPDTTGERAHYRALFSADLVFAHGLLGLINYAGSTMEGYRRNLPKLAGLNIDGFYPGHLMFSIYNGQRHIDVALQRVKEPFMPPSIGQSGITYLMPADY